MIVLLSAGIVLFFTLLAVTVLRPAAFHLAREVPIGILRAPELFMPLAIAAVSAYVLWRYARGKRGAIVLVFIVLLFDLAVWGQSSGWYVGSPSKHRRILASDGNCAVLNSIAPRR